MRLVVAGLACLVCVGPATAETVERTVKANMRTAVGGFSVTDLSTCYTMAVPEAKIEQAPANGSVEILVREWKINEGKQCAGAMSRGPVIVYTPKRGFKGRDEAKISFTPTDRPSGGVFTYTVRVNVE